VGIVIPGYTGGVKTAISVPDETFERVSARAHDLGMSRSEFFARAAARYLDELDDASVTERIDAALASAGAVDSSSVDAVAAGRRLLAGDTDEW
jgi:predicted DNA-binding protein